MKEKVAATAVGTATFDVGPWWRGVNSWGEGDPPHYLGNDPRHPNELSVIWSDPERTEPIAVEDWDGCRALLRREASEPAGSATILDPEATGTESDHA